ncbi:DUF6461 domain-containing protein [Streptomyces sp. NPDC101237]|uniref:DUF6461 domain-containing protein n=1 Tax=Streptomyces sp. NPDC101237 TaxID=3366139 RepID=UPI0038304F25
MASVTAHDYAWIRSSPLFAYALESGYTLTLLRGVAPREVLQVMGAQPHGVCAGMAALIKCQDDLGDSADYLDGSFIAGAFTVPGEDGGWTLVLHVADGGMGMQSRFLEALSDGGRAVVHSSNGGKPLHFFHWYEDGDLRTTFERPTARDGSTPDALNSMMVDVGFALSHDESELSERVDTKAAAFALAEHLTGVRVTEELLQGAEYQLGFVPEEPADEWTGIVIDITDAHGKRLYREITRDEVEVASKPGQRIKAADRD